MLIDRSHRVWGLSSLAVFVVALVVYLLPVHGPAGHKGGTIPGLAFGVAGFAMMVFAGLLSARKQVPARRLGSAQAWLRGHIWLGLLSVPLILFHTGFGWGGLLEIVLWILFALVIVSGIFGLAVQQVLPRLLTSRIPLETFVEQHGYLARRSQFLMDKEVSWVCKQPLKIAENDSIVRACRQIMKFTRDEEQKAQAKAALEKANKARAVAEQAFATALPETKPPAPANVPPAKAAKEEKADWTSVLERDDRAFFTKMALYAKQEGRKGGFEKMSQADHLPRELPIIYATLDGQAESPPANPATAVIDPPSPTPDQALSQDANSHAGRRRRWFADRGVADAAVSALAVTRQENSKEWLKRLYVTGIRPLLADGIRPGVVLSALETAQEKLGLEMLSAPRDYHAVLEKLQQACEEARQRAMQRRIHGWLHGWLLLHVPLSIALLVLALVHIVTALRVIPFSI
jgi:hypothetical protein